MRTKSWGKYLINTYGITLIIVFLCTHFNFWETIVWSSYPMAMLTKYSPDSIIYIQINFGLYGISILLILVQGFILYYAGNLIQKLFKTYVSTKNNS